MAVHFANQRTDLLGGRIGSPGIPVDTETCARAHAHGHAHFPRRTRALNDTARPRPCQRAVLGVGRVQGGGLSCRLFETYQIQDVNSLAIRHIDSNFVSTSLQMCTLVRSHSHLSCVLVRVPRKTQLTSGRGS